MAADARTQTLRETEAALDLLASEPPESHSAEAAIQALATIGASLRLGLSLPAAVRRWLRGLAESEEEAVVELVAELLSRSGLVTKTGREVRDELESVRVALGRRWMAVGGWPKDVPLLQRLDRLLARVDAGGSAPDAGSVALAEAFMDAGVLEAYLSRGAGAEAVEAAAASDPELEAALVESIDSLAGGLTASSAPLALSAWRWRTLRSASMQERARRLEVVPRPEYAAADGARAPARSRSVRLGRLAPFDAEARLSIDAHSATLFVYPGADAISHVEFGAQSVEQARPEGYFELRAELSGARAEDRIRLGVFGASGAAFEVELLLAAEAVDA